jgi:acetyltransferase-like isoleucine patch superfamily enzyme
VICPAVTILGNVRIGESVFVGAATTIGPKLKIGDKCMVGMSSVVTRDLPSQGLYFGTPAKLIRKTQN